MIPEMEKTRVTEIQVRMDCNGCVQKIKKALHSINGICELYVDFPQQKITIIGWADPEKIVKAIKKTRKTAIICSHTEPPDDHPQQTQPPDHDSADAAQGDGPPANPPPQTESSANPGPTENGSPGQEEGQQPAEAPRDPPQSPQHPKLEVKAKTRPKAPAGEAAEAASAGKMTQSQLPTGPKDVEEVHVVHHYPPDYGFRYGYNNPSSMNQGYNGQWHSYPPANPGFRPEPPPQQPIYVTHSYNTHRASPYVTGYEYITPQAASTSPPPQYIQYHRVTPPPENTHYSRPTPTPAPARYTQYSYGRPEDKPSPPPEYTHYSRPTPAPAPAQHTQYSYSRPEDMPSPPPEYTHYSRPPPPPPTRYTQYSYSRPEGYYSEDYQFYGHNGNGNITSAFSDENPNACRIV